MRGHRDRTEDLCGKVGRQNGGVAFVAGNLYRFNGKKYVKQDHKEFELDMLNRMKADGKDFRLGKVKQVVTEIEATGRKGGINKGDMPFLRSGPNCTALPARVIPCDNGLLAVDAFVAGNEQKDFLRPHTAFYVSDFCLPFAFDPEASCPQWLSFLDDTFFDHGKGVVDCERIELLQEVMGYLLLERNDRQKCFMFHGASRSGKSTVAYIAGKLVGDENHHAIDFGDLVGRFNLASLVGKRLVIVNEGDAKGESFEVKPRIMGKLNAIIGRDKIPVEAKYKDTISIELPAKPLIVCNSKPQFHDPAGAFANRLVSIGFYNGRAEGSQDFTLWGRLESELPGIMLWALQGLRRLESKGRSRCLWIPLSKCKTIGTTGHG